MITLSHSGEDVLKQLAEVKKDLEYRLKKVVKNFSNSLIITAIDITPYGNLDGDNEDHTKAIAALYNSRVRRSYGLAPEPGSAKGGWKISYLPPVESGFLTAKDAGAKNIKSLASRTVDKYKLGYDIYIYNKVPYMANDGFFRDDMASIENGRSSQAPTGVFENVIDIMFSTLIPNMQKDFDTKDI